MEINKKYLEILAYGETCDHCLGRFFGKRSHGLSNDERGKGLRVALALETNQPYRNLPAPAGSVATSSRTCPYGRTGSSRRQRISSLPPSLQDAGYRP